MATNYFANITTAGTKAAFYQAMDRVPNVWKNYCQIIPSTAPSEQYTWLGTLPEPREFLSGRDFQGIRDFTMTLANKTYEMSFIIDRESVEDDQHGQIQQRIAEVAEAWATWKDKAFITMLEGTLTGFDSVTFFAATHAVGASGTWDNDYTDATVSDPIHPTVAELKVELALLMGGATGITGLWYAKDDQGRPFGELARTKLRALIPPSFQISFIELVNSTMISTSDNPFWNNWCEIDVCPYLTAPTSSHGYFYIAACGATRKPFIFQERVPLEVVVFNDSQSVADNNGLKVLTRERFRFGAGEFRYIVKHDLT